MATVKRAKKELPGLLFESNFVVQKLDNSKFERVSRIEAKSLSMESEIILDINTDIYPMNTGHQFILALASQLGNPSYASESLLTHNLVGKHTRTLMDAFEYVMYGKIFRLEEKKPDRRIVYATFGGLLFSLTCSKSAASELELDSRIYILLRRADAI